MNRSRPDQIVKCRRTVLETMSVGRAIAIRGDKIWHVVRALVESEYDEGLFEKDLLYLRERGFIRINTELSGSRADVFAPRDLGVHWFKKVYWELTARGSDITHGIISDEALQ